MTNSAERHVRPVTPLSRTSHREPSTSPMTNRTRCTTRGRPPTHRHVITGPNQHEDHLDQVIHGAQEVKAVQGGRPGPPAQFGRIYPFGRTAPTAQTDPQPPSRANQSRGSEV